MIVCSCHGVSDSTLREAAAAGLSHVQIVVESRAGTDCGHCREAVAEIIARSHGPCHSASPCPGCPRRGLPELFASRHDERREGSPSSHHPHQSSGKDRA